MARRPSTLDVLLGMREAREARFRKRPSTELSRQQRLALAPRPPRTQALQYLRTLNAVVDQMRGLTEEYLLPALPELIRSSSGVASAEDNPEAQVGVRADCCGQEVPAWLLRLDAKLPPLGSGAGPSGPYSERLAGLEVALSEMVRDPRLVQVLQDVAGGVDRNNRAELSRVLGIDLTRDPSFREYIDQFLRDNVSLIESIARDQLTRVSEVVARAGAGARVEDVARSIQETFGVSKARAALIANDQVLKANADLTQLRQQRVGVESYIWTSSKDERVRGRPGGKWARSQANHWVLDGTRQLWVRPPVTNPVTGAQNHPGKDFRCRCIAFPLVDDILNAASTPSAPRTPMESLTPPPPVRSPLPPTPAARPVSVPGLEPAILTEEDRAYIASQPALRAARLTEGRASQALSAIAESRAIESARAAGVPITEARLAFRAAEKAAARDLLTRIPPEMETPATLRARGTISRLLTANVENPEAAITDAQVLERSLVDYFRDRVTNPDREETAGSFGRKVLRSVAAIERNLKAAGAGGRYSSHF